MIVGLRHAMYAEWIAGIAAANGLDAEPVTDALGNTTDVLKIRLPDGAAGVELLVMVPQPPDDWRPQ